MVSRIAHLRCTNCLRTVLVVIKDGEPALCPECLRFFGPADAVGMPIWVWGAFAVLCCSAALMIH